ncbi:MAG: hypothetical protein PVK01_01155 [Flavobacteriaceae bacterium]|jgi:hypothetical protein
MIIALTILFTLYCVALLFRILKEFKTGYDLFSAVLYFIIYIVSCGLIYIIIFGTYHLTLSFLN